MATIIRCGGGISKSKYDALNTEYENYKSSHSHTDTEYNDLKGGDYYSFYSFVNIGWAGTFTLPAGTWRVVISAPNSGSYNGFIETSPGSNTFSQKASGTVDGGTYTYVTGNSSDRIHVYDFTGTSNMKVQTPGGVYANESAVVIFKRIQ